MVYDIYFKILLLGLLLLASGLLLISHLKFPEISQRKSDLIFLGMVCLTFAIRGLYLREMELDIDTSTWLSAVIAFNHYPDKLWTLLNYTDARPLTVLPLIMGSWLGLPINYVSAEIIGLLLWLATAFLFYRICLLFADRTISLFIVSSLCMYIATVSADLSAYNSEHVSIGMITLAMAGFVSYVYGKWDHGFIAFLLGCLLGSLVYAKFQNVPMGLVTGIFMAFVMIQKRQWGNTVFLITGSVLPTLLINCYYAALGRLGVFWNSYFWNYFYYSYTTQFSSMPIGERFSLGRVTRFIFYSTNSGVYFMVFSLIITAGLVINYKALAKLASHQKQLLIFAFLLLQSTIYAVLQSGNDFQHYKLYLLVPLLIFSGILISISRADIRRYLMLFLLLGSLTQVAVNIKYLNPVVKDINLAGLDRRVIGSIGRNSKASDPITIWGWRDGLHVITKRPMGYRNVHPFHFSLKSPLIPYWTKDFLEDMEKNRPVLFLEAMIAEYSERGSLYLPHDKVPVVREYVRQHYFLVEELDGVLVYKRHND